MLEKMQFHVSLTYYKQMTQEMLYEARLLQVYVLFHCFCKAYTFHHLFLIYLQELQH